MALPEPKRQFFLAKQLLAHAEESASRSGEASRMLGTLLLYQAVEFLLRTGIRHLADLEKIGSNDHVPDLWQKLQLLMPPGTALPFKAEITSQLRKRRNDVQHGDGVPSESDLARFRGYVRALFEAAFPVLCGCSFADLAVRDLVRNPDAQKFLGDAEASSRRGAHADACAFALIAVEMALFAVHNESRLNEAPVPHDLAHASAALGQALGAKRGLFRAFSLAVEQELHYCRSLALLASLGLNPMAYVRARERIPRFVVLTSTDGSSEVSWREDVVPERTAADFTRMLEYAVSTILLVEEQMPTG